MDAITRGGGPDPGPETSSSESASAKVVAVFHHRAYAEEVAGELERQDYPGLRIAIEDRRVTDDPPSEPAAPGVEPTERRRDAEVAGHVFRNTVMLAVAYAISLGVVAGLVAWGLAGLGTTWFWTVLTVGAFAGAVLGAIQGGIGAAMSESAKEEGSLLIVSLPDVAAANRAAETIARHDPERLDVQLRGRLAG